jgi:prepilin-type N-terminal cleavage/methylation domain-containing protein
MRFRRLKKNQKGFTMIEIVTACVIFPIIVVSTYSAFEAIKTEYTRARQFNEMYAVLSACPEIDRALDYDIVTGANNCYPNNTFYGEGGGGAVFTYTPALTVTPTGSLPNTDPLQAVPDSKVIDITVSRLGSAAPPMELRMLITRNGIGQE